MCLGKSVLVSKRMAKGWMGWVCFSELEVQSPFQSSSVKWRFKILRGKLCDESILRSCSWRYCSKAFAKGSLSTLHESTSWDFDIENSGKGPDVLILIGVKVVLD